MIENTLLAFYYVVFFLSFFKGPALKQRSGFYFSFKHPCIRFTGPNIFTQALAPDPIFFPTFFT